jgi:pyrroloquinoline-quinone synthase
MTQDTSPLLAALDQLIAQYHLLKHPFYQAWSAGTLSRETLALYSEQYYQHVRAFPKNLTRLAARCDGNLEDLVAENLAEELDPAAPHPQLWRQFAHATGTTDAALDAAQPLPGFAHLLTTFRDVSERAPVAEAVASFYAYESQVPEISAEKISGLRKFYNIETPEALAYFSVHQEADVRHRAAWRHWLATETAGADEAAIIASTERTLQALWGALDAVTPQGCAMTQSV